MKNLQNILYRVSLTAVNGSLDRDVKQIDFDSRAVVPGSLFVALKGEQVDGHDFVEKAVANGAVAIVAEKQINFPEEVTFIEVKDAHDALGYLAANFYDNPSHEIQLIGITGTNGKTTTTTLLHDVFTDLGHKCGLLSTVVNKIGRREVPATHTTPNPVALNQLLAEMVEEGCEYCFMEVSSHAIVQRRIVGLKFDIACFTNISHDHLDYHKTFKEYIYAKKRFFDDLGSNAVAIVNADDTNGKVMVQNSSAAVKTMALKHVADYKAKIIENSFSGLVLNLDQHELWTHLIGGFNAYNLLLVYAVAMELDQDQMEVLQAISKLKSVEGRFEHLRSNTGVVAIVDYAHTPDALKNVLSTIQAVRTRNEQVITVVGCGGDRDRKKRPLMAQIAATMSDRVILTSDNPRTEDPQAIIDEMKAGVPIEKSAHVMAITNREEAIKVASTLAAAGDILLVAGKGHEKYQEINGERFPFDDFEIVQETLKNLNK
ncbi:MAG: UDP-N-acetylmuramoyl-L-alanyl-D-glutamate--2,6-diaminopimelate ligase [Crocinitomicaceae bacterium]